MVFAPSLDDEFDLLLGSLQANFQSVEIFGLQPGFLYSTNNSNGAFTLTSNSNASAVPEPAAFGLLSLIAIGLVFRRQKPATRS